MNPECELHTRLCVGLAVPDGCCHHGLPPRLAVRLHPAWLCADDYLFKLLLIGDSGVGKSCLLLRFAVRGSLEGHLRRCPGSCHGIPGSADQRSTSCPDRFQRCGVWLCRMTRTQRATSPPLE